MGRKAGIAIATLKGAAVVTAIDVGVAYVGSFLITAGFVSILGLVMLLESAGLMLIGGAMSFSGQPGIRRAVSILTRTKLEVSPSQMEDMDAKAAAFALVGVLLFLESLLLAAATA